MAPKSVPLVTADMLRRARSGCTCFLWVFILLLLSSLFGGFLGYGYGYSVPWFPFIANVLGIIGASKLRGALGEALQRLEGEEGAKVSVAPVMPRGAPSPQEFLERPITAPAPRPAATKPRRELSSFEQSLRKPVSPSMFENIDWEQWVGKKLLQKVGILIVLIGMIVLLKYSFDNRLIGELGRIGLAVLGAIVLLGAGEWFHRKYAHWSQAFTGGGLVLLYFTVWAAHVFYREELLVQHGLSVSPALAMFLYSLITAIGALAAIRYHAQTIAWFTVLGGYLTPILIETPAPNMVGLTIYLAILAGGVLLLSGYQKWPYLTLAAFALTQLYLFGQIYDSFLISDAQQLMFSIGFFVLFALPPLIAHFRLQRLADGRDIILIVANGLAVFSATVDALGGLDGEYVGLISLCLASIYTAFAAAALERRRGDTLLVTTYLLAASGLVALALFAELEEDWVAVGWAPYSVLLLWVAARLQQRSVFRVALALMGGALLFLMLNMPVVGPPSDVPWHPFTSHWALLNYVVFACMLLWVRLLKGVQDMLTSSEGREALHGTAHVVLAILLFVAVTFEATALDWTVDLPLTFAYLAFAVAALVIFTYTAQIIWFIAAALAHLLVLLFTFVFAESGLVSPTLGGPMVSPLTHSWTVASLASLGLLAFFLTVLRNRPHPLLPAASVQTLFIAGALAQVWLHVTVEIQHWAASAGLSDLLYHRILTGWWIVFTVPLFHWALRKNAPALGRAAVALLLLPLAKDLFRIIGGDATFYETILWTVVPLLVAVVGTRRHVRDFLVGGLIMLAATAATDMLQHLATDAGLLRTIWWAITGLVTMILGFSERETLLRRLAIIIFAATVGKLLIFDFAALSTGVRIGASILTGLLLIGASYLYQRFDSLFAAPSTPPRR